MKIIADNLNIMNPKFARALNRQDAAAVEALVRQCLHAQVDAIDLNPGPHARAGQERMRFLVEVVQSVCELPLLIDTADAKAMEAGLKAARNPVMINGISLEPAKLETILPLALSYDADLVGYLLYPDSRVPPDAGERLAVAAELFQTLTDAGVDGQRLIVDPIVVPVTWDRGPFHAREVLSVIRQLTDLLDFPIRTIAGLSNLTSGGLYRERKEVLESVYMSMLAENGLDMVLVNVLHKNALRAANAGRLLLRSDVFAWEEV
jgi:5-methyltetrahydrofolate corrinoid/iron sulfur protein methyltransferase